MFDWHSLRAIALAVAMLAVVLGVVALLLMPTGTAGLAAHGLAAIGFI